MQQKEKSQKYSPQKNCGEKMKGILTQQPGKESSILCATQQFGITIMGPVSLTNMHQDIPHRAQIFRYNLL